MRKASRSLPGAGGVCDAAKYIKLGQLRNLHYFFTHFKPSTMNTKTAALIIGIVFILVGILGFFPNPIVGACDNSAIFCTDKVHNAVHIISGVLFVLVALASPANAGLVMKIFGVVYFGLGVYGLMTVGSSGMGTLLGFLHVNG